MAGKDGAEVTIPIGSYTIRRHGYTDDWRIFLKADETKMVYVSKHKSLEEAQAEKIRLEDGRLD